MSPASTFPAWAKKLETLADFSGDRLMNEPMSKHTYFKIGGPATAIVLPKSDQDLEVLRRFIIAERIPYQFLGLGSNLLAPDSGISGLFIKTTKLNPMIEREPKGVRAGAGVTVASFLRRAGTEGWGGLECISGIPGTVGGVVVMNGGTHLGEAADRLIEVRTFSFANHDDPWRVVAADGLRYSYRKNHFLNPDEMVHSTVWRVDRGDPATIREKLEELFRRRKETQPLDFPSCGSVFKNPRDSGLRAWEVIDRLGLRGHRIGAAQFAEKHPNWILNLGGAQAADVIALIELAKSRAQSELGVELIEEVRIL